MWEFRSTDGSLDQLPQLADELVRLRVDVILASASSAAMAAKRETTSVPIFDHLVQGIAFTGLYKAQLTNASFRNPDQTLAERCCMQAVADGQTCASALVFARSNSLSGNEQVM